HCLLRSRSATVMLTCEIPSMAIGTAPPRVPDGLAQNRRVPRSPTHGRGNGDEGGCVGDPMTTLGIIGAGHIGSHVARAALRPGDKIVISISRGTATLGDLVAELGAGARAGTVEDAARDGDIVVVAVPLKNYRSVPADAVGDKVVI